MTNLYSSNIHHRRSIRLRGYDYSRPGFYFVTVCVHGRDCLFGKIIDDQMFANEYGRIVQAEWIKTAEMRRDVVLGEFVIMPNHLHGILRIVEDRKHVGGLEKGDRQVGDRQVAPTGPKSKSVGAIMAGFKSAVAKRINIMRETPGAPVWQRNYFEHIIRDDTDHTQIAEYVLTNPRRWRDDKLNPVPPPATPTVGGPAGRPGDTTPFPEISTWFKNKGYSENKCHIGPLIRGNINL